MENTVDISHTRLPNWYDYLYTTLINYYNEHPRFRFNLGNNDGEAFPDRFFVSKKKDKIDSSIFDISLTKNQDKIEKCSSIRISILFSRDPESTCELIPPQFIYSIASIRFQVICRDDANLKYESLFKDIIESVGIEYKGWRNIYEVLLEEPVTVSLKLTHFFDAYFDNINALFFKYPSFGFEIKKEEFDTIREEIDELKKTSLEKLQFQKKDKKNETTFHFT